MQTYVYQKPFHSIFQFQVGLSNPSNTLGTKSEIFEFFLTKSILLKHYSEVPNRRADRNKRAGLEKSATLAPCLVIY